MQLVMDYDYLCYQCAAISESRTISAFHAPTNKTFIFNTRSELWGKKKAKNEGWIAEINETLGKEKYKPEDFVITDVQHEMPLEIAKKILDNKITSICQALDCYDYYGYLGGGENFRHKLATLLPYKGQREDLIKPIHLEALRLHAEKAHKARKIHHLDIESDDAISIDVYAGWLNWKQTKSDKDKVVGIMCDKDSNGQCGWYYNPENGDAPRNNGVFGGLWLNDKGEVKGYGRMWWYFQCAYGDISDNYKSNSGCKVRWGEKAAYNALIECKTDKEAWQVLVGVFKHLYPKPTEIETFRGKIKIDWLYVFQEMVHMAHMRRDLEDILDVKYILTKLGVKH
jgi:hypothetical protein